MHKICIYTGNYKRVPKLAARKVNACIVCTNDVSSLCSSMNSLYAVYAILTIYQRHFKASKQTFSWTKNKMEQVNVSIYR